MKVVLESDYKEGVVENLRSTTIRSGFESTSQSQIEVKSTRSFSFGLYMNDTKVSSICSLLVLRS